MRIARDLLEPAVRRPPRLATCYAISPSVQLRPPGQAENCSGSIGGARRYWSTSRHAKLRCGRSPLVYTLFILEKNVVLDSDTVSKI